MLNSKCSGVFTLVLLVMRTLINVLQQVTKTVRELLERPRLTTVNRKEV